MLGAFRIVASLVLALAVLGSYALAYHPPAYVEELARHLWSVLIGAWVCALLGFVVAMAFTLDENSRPSTPNSLSDIVCWFLLFPQVGVAVGLTANISSLSAIHEAALLSPGVSVQIAAPYKAQLEGEIGPETYESFMGLLNGSRVTMLTLTSEGGSIDDALLIGNQIKQKKIAVLVSDYCESACVLIALSSPNLMVAENSQFGFHRASVYAVSDSQLGRFLSDSGTIDFIEHLRELGMPEDVLSIALNTPADEMYYITGNELVRMGLALHY